MEETQSTPEVTPTPIPEHVQIEMDNNLKD